MFLSIHLFIRGGGGGGSLGSLDTGGFFSGIGTSGGLGCLRAAGVPGGTGTLGVFCGKVTGTSSLVVVSVVTVENLTLDAGRSQQQENDEKEGRDRLGGDGNHFE